MLSTLGYASVIAALLAAAVATVAGARAGLSRSGGEVSASLARRAAYFAFFAMSGGMFVMEVALLTHDFSVEYVARVGSRETPTYYTAISLWSSLEGSILFWGWILAGYGALFAFTRRREFGALRATGERLTALGGGLAHGLRTTPLVLAVIGVVQLFFFGLLAGAANPFGIVDPAPANGPGPNPLLQNHPLMGLHPPMLYFGFVGMTVPFAFAIAALLRGNVEARWLRDARRWMVAAWAFLTMGIIGGGWWSYEVLGWGGAWAWDPVENASFLPWLTATAFLHSAMVQERRGMLKTWNLTLMISTFLLTLFGTFLTRSGVIDSVHAFTEGVVGPVFLAFIAVVAIASLALIGWRSNRLRAPGQVESPASRESAFILNNLLLVGFTFTVLLGTMWPLVVEALRGDRISVGPPYFDQVASPIGLALIFLMGVGPALPWRRAGREQLTRSFVWPAIVGAAAGLLAFALGIGYFLPILTIAFAAFVLTTIADEFRKGIAARRRIAERSFVGALRDLFTRTGQRYGGYVVHVGVIVIALAISVSWTWKTEREMTLRPGERLAIEDYEVELVEVWGREEPHRFVIGATFTAFRNGREIGEEQPRINFYTATAQNIATPAVKSSLTSDLYLTLMAVDPESGAHATVRAIVNPGIVWLWIGGMIMGVGALIAIWPWGRSRVRAAGAELLADPAAAA
ncbi:MAG: heme lyase CcmF/NrfE family subunit [Gemmatimonadales bacterium]|nr:heme lyase CcmF/NrfE family subunit [Gemmatimonadales bacterium]MYG47931.1 heme lyase CcmF/NrfE family subunit [Gemmatimonadales bacterium]MYK02028.1 heme lyase CcmF/NrfE family subunit [Candidatus Palauibacter ramosifaciens]